MSVNPAFANAALQVGCAIECSEDATLSASYPTDLASRQRIGEVVLSIQVTGGFPNGATSWPIADVNGAPRSVSNPALYMKIAVALFGYVAQLDAIVAGSLKVDSLPPQPVSI